MKEQSVKTRVCKTSDIPEQGMRKFIVDDEPILIARIGGEFFAIADTCSHMEASLSEGEIDEYAVQCPEHGSFFDLRTGEALSMPAAAPVETFGVTVEGEDLFLDIED